MHLLNALKIEAHRFSTPPKYMFYKNLELSIETENIKMEIKHSNNNINSYNALKINYYSSPLDSIEPRLSTKKTLEKIAQRPKCPDNFPKNDFYKICEDKKFIDPKYIIIESKNLKNLELSKID